LLAFSFSCPGGIFVELSFFFFRTPDFSGSIEPLAAFVYFFLFFHDSGFPLLEVLRGAL